MQLPLWKRLIKNYGAIFVTSYIVGFFIVVFFAPEGVTPFPGDFRIAGALFPFGSGIGFAAAVTVSFEIYKQFK